MDVGSRHIIKKQEHFVHIKYVPVFDFMWFNIYDLNITFEELFYMDNYSCLIYGLYGKD